VKVHETPQHARWRGCPSRRVRLHRDRDGREIYFSRENVVHPTFDRLEPGAEVQFIEELAAEGVQARRVSVGKHHF